MFTQTKKNPNNKYVCEDCEYYTSNKKDFNKHLSTTKHNNVYKCLQKSQINPKISQLEYTCDLCNKIYKYRQSLCVHRKKCKLTNINENNENTIINTDNENTVIQPHNDIKLLTELVVDLVKSNTDLQKQMLEVCKTNNTTMNMNNCNNKTFNMQVFLNEKCKDAMNLTDFVNSMMLDFSDLEELGELGYVEGISRQMVRKLNEMDIYKRPIHCSDLKRETVYVRDNDVWEKETELYEKLRKAIKYITKKNGDLMIPWRDAHPQCMNLQHPLNDTYLGIMNQAMGGKGEFFDSESKIIKKISKCVTIDKKDM